MPYGKERRRLILEALDDPETYLAVNRQWCANLKYDVDLKRLLKENKIKRVRIGRFRSRTTRLVKT